MPSRSASVPYSPDETVSPELTGEAHMSQRASPEDFGAQVGQSIEKLGETGQHLGAKAVDLAIQQQGQINETLSTNADVKFQSELGSLYGKYSSLSGMEAVKALPQLQTDLEASRQRIRSNLPGGADKAFDMLSARSMGYRITSANEYAARQLKAAQMDAGVNLVNAATISAADPSIAGNDEHFGNLIGDIKHGVGMQTSADHVTPDGNWADTPEGNNEQQNYQQNVDNAVGQAHANRYDTLATTMGPIAAHEKFESEKEYIPPVARAHIEAKLLPQVQGVHAHNASNAAITEAKQEHNEMFLNPPSKMDIADAIHVYGEGGGLNSTTSVDGAVGGWQITPGTFAQYARPNENINTPKDNEAVGRRIVDDLKAKYPNDPDRVAVGYFSGPGNVSPPGSPTPWKQDLKDGNGTSVSDYVTKVQKGMGEHKPNYATNPDGSPLTQADYYQTHRAEVIQKGDSYAERTMPGNMEFRNAVRARLTQQMDAAISDQRGQYKQDNDFIMRAFNGDFTKGKHPTSMEELEAIKDVGPVVSRAMVHSPEFMRAVDQRLLSAASKGENKDMKDMGLKIWDTFNRIHADPSDPNRITDPKQIYSLGNGNGLTLGGVEKMVKELHEVNPLIPKGEDGELRKQSFKAARAMVLGKNDYPGVPLDPEAERIWGHAMRLMYEQEKKGREANPPIPDSELYDSEGKNWIGNIAKPLTKTLDQRIAAINSKLGSDKVSIPPIEGRNPNIVYNSPNGPIKWVPDKGWISVKEPEVPTSE